ncbi:MAG: hypothetical protein R2690_15275 [Acidimicrobiales bacterium]
MAKHTTESTAASAPPTATALRSGPGVARGPPPGAGHDDRQHGAQQELPGERLSVP